MGFAALSAEKYDEIGKEFEARLKRSGGEIEPSPENIQMLIGYLKGRDLGVTVDNLARAANALINALVWKVKPHTHPETLHKMNLAGIRHDQGIRADIDATFEQAPKSPMQNIEDEVTTKKIESLQEEISNMIQGYGCYRFGKFIASITQERREALKKIRVTGKGSQVANLEAIQRAVHEAIQKYPD